MNRKDNHQATDNGRNRGDYKTEKETVDELRAKGTRANTGDGQDDDEQDDDEDGDEQDNQSDDGPAGNNERGNQKGYGKNQGKEPADRGTGHGPQGVRHGKP